MLLCIINVLVPNDIDPSVNICGTSVNWSLTIIDAFEEQLYLIKIQNRILSHNDRRWKINKFSGIWRP